MKDSSHKSCKENEKDLRLRNLIALLSDGAFHSGESLGASMGVSRAAVWKQIQFLQTLGLSLETSKGRGYRIPGGLMPLLDAHINEKLTQNAREVLQSRFIFQSIDSSNQYLLDLLDSGTAHHGMVCLAEQQTAGRGRRGRPWVSPFGQNIYCSLLWSFDQGLAALEGLSLVVALSLVKALESEGCRGLGLKWPNDILVDGKKLAGILLEVRGDVLDRCDVVLGFGINVAMKQNSAKAIDQDWTDLRQMGMGHLDRNALVAAMLNKLVEMLALFSQKGFAEFQSQWNEYDIFLNQKVNLANGKERYEGLEKGVDAQGALLLDLDGSVRTFHGGELSLRPGSLI